MIECLLVFENIEAGQGGGAADGVGGVTMSVVERVRCIAAEGVIHPRGGECGGHGNVSGCEAFGEAEKIRDHALVLAGKHGPRPAEACHDFIEDQMYSMPVTPSAQLAEHAGRPRAHFIHALDDRFDHEGGDARRIHSC